MQWFSDLPFSDNRVVQYGFLAACGIAALVILAIVYRLVFAHRLRVPGGRTRQPRLGLVDAFSLDGQRQLVLVRRDNVEHLIMIGGPNDVLVESQINRALASARENNMTSGSTASAAPTRRTEPVAAPPPAPAAAPPGKAAAQATAPAPSTPAIAARTVSSSPEVRPIRPQTAAPEATTASGSSSAPAAAPPPSSPSTAPAASPTMPAANASPPAAAKVIQTGRLAPMPESRPQPRPLPARPSMPPPIMPAAAQAGRAHVAHLTDKHPPTAPAATPPASAVQPKGAEVAPQTQTGKNEPPAAGPKTENRVSSSVEVSATMAPIPSHTPATAKVELKTDHPSPSPAPAAVSAAPANSAHPSVQSPAPPASQKLPTKSEGPFAGLDTLEAEMARLLGREKPN